MSFTGNWIDESKLIENVDEIGKTIINEFGITTYLKLLELFSGQQIYFSEKALNKIKKIYVQEVADGTNIKRLSREISKSQSFIYKAMSEKYNK